eukprot:CAMPEP_0117850364 /NCGR_PEP_ID=MMETSP0949-20121206/21640_1 /TAXON_ID=44440 /ORGANISM="Chattonella subsalsa, Strain CCMP2191" /LENGTH=329 /DNA_ID=CAMNT_0005697737 /DNA_START=296 /DNA_END=1286 /DNA_ORIENTATION=+
MGNQLSTSENISKCILCQPNDKPVEEPTTKKKKPSKKEKRKQKRKREERKRQAVLKVQRAWRAKLAMRWFLKNKDILLAQRRELEDKLRRAGNCPENHGLQAFTTNGKRGLFNPSPPAETSGFARPATSPSWKTLGCLGAESATTTSARNAFMENTRMFGCQKCDHNVCKKCKECYEITFAENHNKEAPAPPAKGRCFPQGRGSLALRSVSRSRSSTPKPTNRKSIQSDQGDNSTRSTANLSPSESINRLHEENQLLEENGELNIRDEKERLVSISSIGSNGSGSTIPIDESINAAPNKDSSVGRSEVGRGMDQSNNSLQTSDTELFVQ